RAEDEAHEIKGARLVEERKSRALEGLRDRGYECECRGNHTPGNHDPGNPPPRPDLFQDEVRGHLEDEVAEEEDADAEAEHFGGKAELLVHGERRKPGIDAIEIGDEVTQDQKWNEAPRGFARCLLIEGVHHNPPRTNRPRIYCFNRTSRVSELVG